MADISPQELALLRRAFEPLVGLRISWLSLPVMALAGFEPSQLAVIVNTLMDGLLPQIQQLATNPENAGRLSGIGLSKFRGTIGERESYPDYVHVSGKRIELKGLFVDNVDLDLKRPPTAREPSARLKENVTIDAIDPANDALMVAAAQLRADSAGVCSPCIVDVEIFSMVECIRARDDRLASCGGRWFGKIPKVIKSGRMRAYRAGAQLSEVDFEKDTNFGKLNRIPYEPLQRFLAKHGIPTSGTQRAVK